MPRRNSYKRHRDSPPEENIIAPAARPTCSSQDDDQYQTLRLSTPSCGRVIIRYRKPAGKFRSKKLRSERGCSRAGSTVVPAQYTSFADNPTNYRSTRQDMELTTSYGNDSAITSEIDVIDDSAFHDQNLPELIPDFEGAGELTTFYCNNNTVITSEALDDQAFENLPDLSTFEEIRRKWRDKDLDRTQVFNSDTLPQVFNVQSVKEDDVQTPLSSCEEWYEDSGSFFSPDSYDTIFQESTLPPDSLTWMNSYEGVPGTTEPIDSCTFGESSCPSSSYFIMLFHPDSEEVVIHHSEEMKVEYWNHDELEQLVYDEDQLIFDNNKSLCDFLPDIQPADDSCVDIIDQGPIDTLTTVTEWSSSILECSIKDDDPIIDDDDYASTGEATITSDNLQPIVQLNECKESVKEASISDQSQLKSGIDDWIVSPSHADCSSSHNSESNCCEFSQAIRLETRSCKRRTKGRVKRVDYQCFLNANYHGTAVDEDQLLHGNSKDTKSKKELETVEAGEAACNNSDKGRPWISFPESNTTLQYSRRRRRRRTYFSSTNTGVDQVIKTTGAALRTRRRPGQGPGRKRKASGPLPKEAIEILSNWFKEHSDFPYADRSQRKQLVLATGLHVTQIDNWLSNNRHKLKIKKADYAPGISK